jgi:predicted nucleic acid-binding Zn ribbon protein
VLILLIIGGLLYWFIWRKKPLTEAEKIAALPPYERAKLALEKLDEERYFENKEIKTFYSDLTLILRQYLDEKVYDQSLESTTDELVFRLKTLQAANQITLSANTIRNIETILKRADLVKFAKSKPDFELAKLDKGTIGLEIEHVKEGLPEPTEEELLQDLQYREKIERKQKRNKRNKIITLLIGVLLLVVAVLIIRSGFTDVKDTVLRNPSKLLLEKTAWVTSEYGAPGITISTPEVLERQLIELPQDMKGKVQISSFAYAGSETPIDVVITSSKYASEPSEGGKKEEKAIDVLKAAEGVLDNFEKEGAKNIISRNEQFITPNGQEGVKTFGVAEFIIDNSLTKGEYVVVGFSTPNLLQEVVLIWKKGDVYADQIMERIINSIELISLTEEKK